MVISFHCFLPCYILLVLKVLSSRYKCGETVRGDAVNEPPPVAPPVFPYDVAFAPSLDRSFELESSILAASSQFSQYFIDHIIETLKRIIMSEPVSALDMQHLNVLTYCAHMHRINQYGESFSSVRNGSDNISLPKQTVNVEHLRIPTGLCSGLLPAAIVDGNELKLSSDPMDVRVAKKMGLSNDTTTPACDSVCTNRDSLPLGHVSKKCRVSMECGKKTINVATSVKGVEIVETPNNNATKKSLLRNSDHTTDKSMVLSSDELSQNTFSYTFNNLFNVGSDEWESDSEYEMSSVSTNDHVLDSDIQLTDHDEDDDSADGDYVMELRSYHRDAFYKSFTPYYNTVSKSSKLITDEKYQAILDIVRQPKRKKETALMIKYRRLYSVDGNIAKRCLYRKNKVVTTFEQVFDVILEAHTRISHARNPKTNLSCITDTLGYYGVPVKAVECFIQTCPLVRASCYF